jgi:hypothetical protein
MPAALEQVPANPMDMMFAPDRTVAATMCWQKYYFSEKAKIPVIEERDWELTPAFQFAQDVCRQQKVHALHLEVLEENTAIDLYQRHDGFEAHP